MRFRSVKQIKLGNLTIQVGQEWKDYDPALNRWHTLTVEGIIKAVGETQAAIFVRDRLNNSMNVIAADLFARQVELGNYQPASA